MTACWSQHVEVGMECGWIAARDNPLPLGAEHGERFGREVTPAHEPLVVLLDEQRLGEG